MKIARIVDRIGRAWCRAVHRRILGVPLGSYYYWADCMRRYETPWRTQ